MSEEELYETGEVVAADEVGDEAAGVLGAREGGVEEEEDECDPAKMTRDEYEACELEFVKNAVRKIEEKNSAEKAWDHDVASKEAVRDLIDIVRGFLMKRKLVCYGGTAINNILPKEAQFYNYDIEIPDYDFYSKDSVKDATDLADIFYSKGYEEVEAKAGAHFGTIKVFVNYLAIADLSQIPQSLFDNLQKHAVIKEGIHYCPPDFLRMNIYAELCRPMNEIARWQKIYKRFLTLNKHYPIVEKEGDKDDDEKNCKEWLSVDLHHSHKDSPLKDAVAVAIEIARKVFVREGLVFIGGYALSKYDAAFQEKSKSALVDFTQKFIFIDVLAEKVQETADLVLEKLASAFRELNVDRKFVAQVKLVHHAANMDLFPESVEIFLSSFRIAHIYHANHCYSFNTIKDEASGLALNIASIDTMIYFYFLFYYMDKPYYDKKRLVCMSHYLMRLTQQKSLSMKEGVFARFTRACYGKDHSLESMKIGKKRKYKDLVKQKDSAEYKLNFFSYRPHQEFLKKQARRGRGKATTRRGRRGRRGRRRSSTAKKSRRRSRRQRQTTSKNRKFRNWKR